MKQRGIDPEFCTVTPIRYKEEDGGGTGFFLNRDGRTYLVTNRHVVDPDDNEVNPESAYIWLRNRNDLGTANRNAIRLVENDNPRWRGHPDDTTDVDLAVLPLHPRLSTLDDVHDEDTEVTSGSLAFTTEHFIHENVGVDQRVSIIGYPGDFMDRSTRLPVRRNALISSPYGYSFAGEPYFLTDARMHPGTSGSPVVMRSRGMQFHRGDVPDNRSKNLYLLGVHSATFHDSGFKEHELDEAEDKKKGEDDEHLQAKLDLNAAWYPGLINAIIDQ